jgi:hypothetical protein
LHPTKRNQVGDYKRRVQCRKTAVANKIESLGLKGSLDRKKMVDYMREFKITPYRSEGEGLDESRIEVASRSERPA